MKHNAEELHRTYSFVFWQQLVGLGDGLQDFLITVQWKNASKQDCSCQYDRYS